MDTEKKCKYAINNVIMPLEAVRNYYYNNDSVLFNMANVIRDKEISILDFSEFKCLARRCDNKKGTDPLKKYLIYFEVAKNIKRNLYMSSANYSSFPNMIDGNGKRKKNLIFWNYVREHILSYDFLIDFDLDCEEHRLDLLDELLKFKLILDTYKIKYYLLFSGNGYHLILIDTGIPLKFTDDTDSTRLIYYYRLGHKLKETFRLKYSCLVGCGGYNRISKLPYSLYMNRIILPIEKKDMNLSYLNNINNFIYDQDKHTREFFFRRGLHIQHETSGKEQFIEFLSDFNINLDDPIKDEVLENGIKDN